MHTENQLPRLSGSALKVPVWWGGGVGWGGVVASYPFLSQAPTPVEVELGCDNSADPPSSGLRELFGESKIHWCFSMDDKNFFLIWLGDKGSGFAHGGEDPH